MTGTRDRDPEVGIACLEHFAQKYWDGGLRDLRVCVDYPGRAGTRRTQPGHQALCRFPEPLGREGKARVPRLWPAWTQRPPRQPSAGVQCFGRRPLPEWGAGGIRVGRGGAVRAGPRRATRSRQSPRPRPSRRVRTPSQSRPTPFVLAFSKPKSEMR